MTVIRAVWISTKIKENFSIYGFQPLHTKHITKYRNSLRTLTIGKRLQNSHIFFSENNQTAI